VRDVDVGRVYIWPGIGIGLPGISLKITMIIIIIILICVAGIQITAGNVVELMVASDKLGISSVTGQCCDVIDKCPLDRVLQIVSDASDIGLNDLALLDSRVSQRLMVKDCV